MLTKTLSHALVVSVLWAAINPALGLEQGSINVNSVQATVHVSFPFDTSYSDVIAGVEEIAPRPHDFEFTIGDINNAKSGSAGQPASAAGAESGGENVDRDGWVTKDFNWLVYEHFTSPRTINPRVIYNSTCYVSILPILTGETNFELKTDPPFLSGDIDKWDDVVIECPETKCMPDTCDASAHPEPTWTGKPDTS
ncbi:hypothetical protein IAU59_002338 [Kwoniella sp. CBS 9459]